MDITVIGMWVMLALGVVTVFFAIRLTVKQAVLRALLLSWVFGVALAGVGTFGPGFLDPYSDFLKVVFDAMGSPSEETYAAVVDQIASEDVPDEIRELGLSFMLENPIEGMDAMLAEGMAKTDQVGARTAFTSARKTLEVRSEAAAAALSPRRQRDASGAFERPALRLSDDVRRELVKPLLAQPDSVLTRYQLDRDALKQMESFRPRR